MLFRAAEYAQQIREKDPDVADSFVKNRRICIDDNDQLDALPFDIFINYAEEEDLIVGYRLLQQRWYNRETPQSKLLRVRCQEAALQVNSGRLLLLLVSVETQTGQLQKTAGFN